MEIYIIGAHIFQAKDDESVAFRPVAKFAKATGAKLKLLPRGGHMKTTFVVEKYWPQIAKFLRE